MWRWGAHGLASHCASRFSQRWINHIEGALSGTASCHVLPPSLDCCIRFIRMPRFVPSTPAHSAASHRRKLSHPRCDLGCHTCSARIASNRLSNSAIQSLVQSSCFVPKLRLFVRFDLALTINALLDTGPILRLCLPDTPQE